MTRWRSHRMRPALVLYVGGCRVLVHRRAFLLWPWYVFVAIHELGHAVAARVVGAPVRSVAVGPCGRAMGWVSMHPFGQARARGLRRVVAAGAGPLASFLTAAAFGVAMSMTASRLVYIGLSLPFAVNLAMGIVNAVPYKVGNDGWLVWYGWCEWRAQRRRR